MREEGEEHGVYCFGKRNIFRLDLKESREIFSFGDEGEGHSIERGRRRKRLRNRKVDSLVRGLWRLRESEEYGRVCKVEDSHRDNTVQCTRYIYIAESVDLVVVLNSLWDWKEFNHNSAFS